MVASRARSPPRTIAWSSTSNTPIIWSSSQPTGTETSARVPWLGAEADDQRAASLGDQVTERPEAEMALVQPTLQIGGVEAAAVIVDDEGGCSGVDGRRVI